MRETERDRGRVTERKIDRTVYVYGNGSPERSVCAVNVVIGDCCAVAGARTGCCSRLPMYETFAHNCVW